ncbi:MAG: 50S ribosomal protein L10 [Armatimonadetes bacterium]|nr:50S ribosomal protein L10 [Armatimonadota bacterium]
MPTAEKTAVIEQTRQWRQESTGMVFTDYRGLKVHEIQALRESLRVTGGEYHVVKNTLLRIALGDDMSSLPEELHNGPTATAFIFREEPACAKLLVKFAKDHKGFEIKGGYLDGKALSSADVEAFSKLPSRQELLSMIVGLVQAPIANVVGTINEMLLGPIRVIAAIADKAGPAPEPENAEPAPAESEPAAEPAATEEAPTEEAPAIEAGASEGEEPTAEAPVEAEATPETEPAPTEEEPKEGQE